VVLAVSPNDTQVLINDQVRQLFYIYSVSGGSATTIGGMGNAAAWTPDSQTLYITDNASLNNTNEGITGHTDTLYVYNANTGWTTYALPRARSPIRCRQAFCPRMRLRIRCREMWPSPARRKPRLS